MTGERGYHFFANLVWRNWTVTATFSGDNRTQPVSWGPTIFNDPGTQVTDSRDFVEAVYTRKSGDLRWRTYSSFKTRIAVFERSCSARKWKPKKPERSTN
jgi:hypothetical protein